jgi:hypothetical protein
MHQLKSDPGRTAITAVIVTKKEKISDIF